MRDFYSVNIVVFLETLVPIYCNRILVEITVQVDVQCTYLSQRILSSKRDIFMDFSVYI